MANNCFFSMRASGTTEAVDRVIDFLNTHHYDGCDIEDANDMYSADGYEKTITAYGDVKWAVLTAWNMHKYNNDPDYMAPDDAPEPIKTTLKNLEKRRIEGESILDIKDVNIEVYSEECGMGFAEHYIAKDGKLVLDDTRTYTEEFHEFGDDEACGEHTIYNGGYAEQILDFDETKEIPAYDHYIEQ
jgi:hypothetical protein